MTDTTAQDREAITLDDARRLYEQGAKIERSPRFEGTFDRWLAPLLADARAEGAQDRKLLGQANYLLAKIVAVANVSAVNGDDGFIEGYDIPTGPIHKAIPFLTEQGIVVTNDGRVLNSPETIAEDAAAIRQETR